MLAAAAFLGMAAPAHAVLVEVVQDSSPAGFVAQSNIILTGESFTTVSPPLTTSGHVFAYWAKDGGRLTDDNGFWVNKVTVTVDAAMTLTAHYVPQNEDSDGDGLLDWFEYRHFGNLGEDAAEDPDHDDFTNGQEIALGQEPTIADETTEGGISARLSANFQFADASLLHYLVKSDPAGFVNGPEGYVVADFNVTTPNLHGESYGHHFAYWTINGVRQAGSRGVAKSQVTTAITGETTIVAHYVPTGEDNDTDGVADWFELNQFGDLSLGPTDDPDSDGFSNTDESALGQEATIHDQATVGGISGRLSATMTFADVSLLHYLVTSDPKGFVNGPEGYVVADFNVTTPNLHGESHGHHFAYWTINGVRQASSRGVAKSQVTATITGETTIVAHYVPSGEDNDTDGVADWFELNQFGNLSLGPTDDPDSDSFTNADESALGQEATIPDQTTIGGISARLSTTLTYYLQDDPEPQIEGPFDQEIELGQPFTRTLAISGPISSLQLLGDLPPGIGFFAGSNTFSGSPLLTGSHTFKVVVTGGSHTVEKDFTMRVTQSPTTTTELTAPDANASDYFGASVALRGDWAVVGAVLADVNGEADAGAAYLFGVDANATASAATKLTDPTPQAGAEFGSAVSVAAPWIVVGGPLTDAQGTYDAGSASVYQVESNGSVAHAATLSPDSLDLAMEAHFGYAVAVDGNRALVGAPGSSSLAGAAYLFDLNGSGQPTSVTKISPADGATGDDFGAAVSLSGTHLMVGAPGADQDKGAAYFFKIETNGSVTQTARWDRGGAGAAGDRTGEAVVIEGFHAVVGSPVARHASGPNGGIGTRVKLTPDLQVASFVDPPHSSDASGDRFGSTASWVENSSDFLFGFGMPNSDPDGQADGGAFDLHLDNADGSTSDLKQLTAPSPNPSDEFGISSAIDAKRVIVGAWKADLNFTSNVGAAYLFHNPDWGEEIVIELNLAIAVEGPGSVTGDGLYLAESNATITATPDPGTHFVGWLGAGPVDPNATVTTVPMTAGRSITAKFEINSYDLVVDSTAGGDATGSGTFTHGMQATITTTPDANHHFVKWVGPGVADRNAPTTTVAMTSDRNATAKFAINAYDLTVTAGAGGSATGSGSFDHGTTVTITATPDTDHAFTGWSGPGVADPTATSTTVTMLGDGVVTANFVLSSVETTLVLGSSGIVENAPADTSVGVFSVLVNGQLESGYSFALTADGNGNKWQKSLFKVGSGNGALRNKSSFDFEQTTESPKVFVRATKGDDSVEDLFVIEVLDQNEAPALALDPASPVAIVEGTGVFVTTASATDPEGSAITYGLASGGDAQSFVINVVTGSVSFASEPDFEHPGDLDQDNEYHFVVNASDGVNKTTASLIVRVTDDGTEDGDGDGLSDAQEIEFGTSPTNPDSDEDGQEDGLEVTLGSDPTDPDSQPALSLSNNNLREGLPADAVVGRFSLNNVQGARFFLVPASGKEMDRFRIDEEGYLLATETLNKDEGDEYFIRVMAEKSDRQLTTILKISVLENALFPVTGTDYEESALMMREKKVVNDPLRTGLNPIDKIESLGSGVFVTTKRPHGRRTGDSVVLAGVKGLTIKEVKNWNFMVDEVTNKRFRLRLFGANGALGAPVTAKGTFKSSNDDFLLGPWTFGHLIGNMVGEQDAPEDFLAHFLSQWSSEQMINGWPTDARKSFFGRKNLARLPFRLLAIGNRLDLFKANSIHEVGSAGEGRFVFCLTGGFSDTSSSGYVMNAAAKKEATFIFEYGQRAGDFGTLASWTQDWHRLSDLRGDRSAAPPKAYLEHLEKIGHRFSKRGADPDKPNGNSINQVRTNEIVIGTPWQLREFVLNAKTQAENLGGQTKITASPTLHGSQVGLWSTTTKGNPMVDQFNDSPLLVSWINRMESKILDGEVSPPIPSWLVGGIANEDGTLAPRGTRVNLARHKVGLSTCAGCHTGETNTAFTMIKPRRYNVISRLAAFMTGTRSAHDPVVAGETHFYDDLAAREGVMRNLLEVSRTALPKKIRLSRVDFPANLKPGNKAAEIIVLGGSATHWALSLVAGPGADHNAAFSIAGNALLVQGSALPPGPLSVRIRATAIDAAGNTDASGVFIEKTQSLWSRKAGVSVKLSSRAFEATTTTETPALLTPRPFRIH